MPVCANCHTDGQAAGAACRFCGAWVALNAPGAGDGPADPRGSADPRGRTPNPLSAPSLELQIPPRRHSGTGMSAVSAPASRPSSGNVPLTAPTPGGGVDDDDDMPLASLELDIRPAPGQLHTAGRAMAQLSGVGITSEPPSPLSSPRTGNSTPAPPSRAPSSRGPGSGSLSGGGGAGVGAVGGIHSYERTDDEARALADYGDPPASFWLAPLYALRVHSRRAEIARELETRQEDFSQAKKAIEDALVTLAGRARAVAEPIPLYRGPLSAITAAEELLRTRDGQLSSSMDVQNKRVGEVDARISVLEEKLAGALTEQKRLEAELRSLQERMQRKSAQDAATRAALGSGDDPRSRRPGP